MRLPTPIPMLMLVPALVLICLACSALPSGDAAADAADVSPSETAVSGPAVAGLNRAVAWFTDITDRVGLDFVHDAGVEGGYLLPEIVSGGGALLDADGDGDLDIYLIDSGVAGAGNRMLFQEDDGSFFDVTDLSGTGDGGRGMGCAVGDVDNDGDPDLLVTNLGPDRLFLNDGAGRFTDVTDRSELAADEWSTSAVFFDYDRDGHLDLFVTTYLIFKPPKSCLDTTGRTDYCGPRTFPGLPDRLYRNRGDGTFEDVGVAAGIGRAPGKGLGVWAADFDDDGDEDIYVANDGEENRLWINRGDGTFEDRALMMGAAVNLHGQTEASMGLAVGDMDGDGDPDLFMSHLDRETNTFYANIGGAVFEDRTASAGLGGDSLPYTGFGTALFDPDADGRPDLVVANGRVRRVAGGASGGGAGGPGTGDPFQRDFGQPNQLFVHAGPGRFVQAPERAGPLGEPWEVSRSVILGDVDGDGAEDLLVTNGHGRARLYRSSVPDAGGRLTLDIRNPELNRVAIGARVEVHLAGETQVRWVTRNGSYLAARDAALHFGLGAATAADAIRVRWPDGSREAFPGAPAGARTRIEKGRGLPDESS